jgi:AraC-like DNA-binding protein
MTMTNHLSTVDFIIPAESVQTVVKLLLTHQISFMLKSSNDEECSIQVNRQISEIDINQDKRLGELNQIYAAIERIYQKYIEEDIRQIPPKEPEIAKEFKISLAVLKSSFKEVYGKPFYQLYMERKMEYAKTLLLEGMSATKVSELIGYSQPIKFNKMFQKHFGITPKKYQMSHITVSKPGI